MTETKTIAILGAGTMGNGIAHVCARSGFNVLLYDVNQTALYRGLDTIRTNFAREVAKAEAHAAAGRRGPLAHHPHHQASTISRLLRLPSKPPPNASRSSPQIFRDLDRILPAEAILATNTSSISITKIAAQTKRPEQVIGMHFFNPVPVMKLVEIIRGLQTSQDTFDTVYSLSQQLGKTPVEVNDAAGFVSNRVLMPLINEAIYAVMEGVATPEAVDQVFVLGHGAPHGAAYAGGLHRPRRLRRHHARARRRSRQPQIQSLPAAGPHGRCGLARPQIGPRLLHLPGKVMATL